MKLDRCQMKRRFPMEPSSELVKPLNKKTDGERSAFSIRSICSVVAASLIALDIAPCVDLFPWKVRENGDQVAARPLGYC